MNTRFGVLLLCCLSPLWSTAQEWDLDESKTEIRFETENPAGDVTGTFDPPVAYMLRLDSLDLPSSKIKAKIDVRSLQSGLVARDAALMKEDYFDVEEFPFMTFESQKIEALETGYLATGILSIKGITREVLIPFTFHDRIFEASFILKRKDYNIGGNNWMLGDEAKILLYLPVK
ncbi:MAG: YceI family protein [Bacteroidota bacterium]